jgi:hypothetical protein
MRIATIAAVTTCGALLLVTPGNVDAGACSDLRLHEDVGIQVVLLPDLDDDQVPEYAAANPQAGAGGLVHVYSGRTGELRFAVTGDGTPSLNGELFGSSIAPIEDVGSADGSEKDGVPDILIGAPRLTRNNASLGYVRVVSGADGAEILRVTGVQSAELFGASVTSPGDLNDDKWADFAVGVPGVGGGRPGAVRFFSGRDGAPLIDRGAFGTDPGGNLGSALASIGDVDGDGVPDVAAGARSAQGTRGEVVFLPGAGGEPIRTIVGRSGDRIGGALRTMPDVDRDGIDELLVSSLEGRSFAVSPRRGKKLFQLGPGSLGHIGDVDGDGITDVGLYTGTLGSDVQLEGYLSSKLIGGRASKALAFVCPAASPGFASLPPFVGLGNVDGDGGAEVLLADANGARVVSIDATSSSLKLKVAATLQRQEVSESRAAGSVQLEAKKDLRRVALKLKKLPTSGPLVFTVHLEDAPDAGTYTQVAEVTASAKGGGGVLLSATGRAPVELGVEKLADLAGRRIEIRDDSGAVVLATIVPPFAARDNEKTKGTLPAAPQSPVPGASAKYKAIFKGAKGASVLDIKVKKIDKRATYSLWIESAPGSENLVSIGELSKGRFVANTARGDPLPFGVPSVLDLAGRRVEVRDSENAPVVAGTLD